MLRSLTLIAFIVALAATLTAASGSSNWSDFPEFRHVSTLPGNGFGVTPDGVMGFDGALQQNIPVAYTPHGGQYIMGYWSGSTSSKLALGFGGTDVSGTGMVGAGLGKGDHPVYVSYMIVDARWHLSLNAQCQVLQPTEQRPAVSVGVLDALNMRLGVNGVPHGARSFYATATKRAGGANSPVYVTLGLGNGRFGNGPFGGISWSATDHWTAALEYDGQGTNAGVAYGLRGRQAEGTYDAVAFLGYAGLERPVVGIAGVYRR